MIEKTIREAVYYAEKHLGLQKEDAIYVENLILAHFGAAMPFEGIIDEKSIDAYRLPDPIFDALVVCLTDERKMDDNAAEREATWAMGILSPLPSAVDARFAALMDKDPQKATDYLYELSVKNDYVAKSKIDKNILWEATFPDGPSLEMSINLSKPEKNNKDIAKLVNAKATGYPKCLLCKENLGFEGNLSHPARENIRFVPLTLGGGRWYLQYSPYGYYDQHCIVFFDEHVPMAVNDKILSCLLDFVDQFPHFFIGSNSDLPIVGGSILNHEHFQGGKHYLPLLTAKSKERLMSTPKGSVVSLVDFYVTAIRIEGQDREDVLKEAGKILKAWRNYQDPENDIVAFDEAGQHSTCTPFVTKKGESYSLTLVLRNNRCDARYPDGIFHAHPEFHAIKKEGIGLIEAAGLFILPARLVRQSKEVEDVIARRLSLDETLALYPDLSIFQGMIEEMKATGETSRDYMNKTCQGILRNVAVYKEDAKGQKGLHAFLKEAI